MVFKSLNDAAYAIIRKKILLGEYDLGGRIREDLLAQEITISRTPIREAINRLVADGIIIRKSQRGLYLIDPSPEQIADTIDIRISLEKLSVAQCIERAAAGEIRKITASLREFERALKRRNYRVCNELDGDFHTLIATLSRNDRLIRMLNDLSLFFHLVRQEEKKDQPEAKNQLTLEEHAHLAEAIAARDTEAAKEAVAANIETMRNNLFSSTRYAALQTS